MHCHNRSCPCHCKEQSQPEWERVIEACVEIRGNKAYDGCYAAPREAYRKILQKEYERGLADGYADGISTPAMKSEYEHGREEGKKLGRDQGSWEARNDTLDEVEKIVDGMEELNRDGFTWIRKHDLKAELKANRDNK